MNAGPVALFGAFGGNFPAVSNFFAHGSQRMLRQSGGWLILA
jgi:hypothetical protein